MLIAVFIFLFGLIIGSFLNVCILRIPEGKSIVLPASACTKCGAAIRPYDNIPVISYLLLGGKCRKCKTKISPMYPVVEFLTGLLFLACYEAFGLTFETLKWSVFCAFLVVLLFTDLKTRTLPDAVTLTGAAIGVAFSLFTNSNDGTSRWLFNTLFNFFHPNLVLSLFDSVLGGVVGGGLIWGIREGWYRLFGRHGMGFGDVKMLLFAGTFMGIKRTVLMIFVGSLVGSFVGSILLTFLFLFGWRSNVAIRAHRRGIGPGSITKLRFTLVRRYELPFGTYLAFGGIAVVFFGTPIINWYQSLLGMR